MDVRYFVRKKTPCPERISRSWSKLLPENCRDPLLINVPNKYSKDSLLISSISRQLSINVSSIKSHSQSNLLLNDAVHFSLARSWFSHVPPRTTEQDLVRERERAKYCVKRRHLSASSEEFISMFNVSLKRANL